MMMVLIACPMKCVTIYMCTIYVYVTCEILIYLFG